MLKSKKPAIFYFRFAAGIIIAFLLLLLLAGEPEPPLLAGSQAPVAEVTSYDGQKWKLSGLYGKPLLVNFWATWCGPCRYEIPHLVDLAKKHQDKIQVVGLVIDSPPAAVAEIVDEFGITYPIAVADGRTIDQWRAFAVPATYLLDASGRILWSSRGAMTRSTLHEVVERHLFSAK